MQGAVAELVVECGWKFRTLLRTRRYYTDADLVLLYKSHVLNFVDYRTAGIYHGTQAV